MGVIVIVSVAHSLADEYKIARAEFRKNDPRLTKSKGSSRILFEKNRSAVKKIVGLVRITPRSVSPHEHRDRGRESG